MLNQSAKLQSLKRRLGNIEKPREDKYKRWNKRKVKEREKNRAG